MSSKKEHWETIYKTKDHTKVGWYQESPDISLSLFTEIHAQPSQSVIDIGCGASLLADHLITQGYKNITLVDLSSQALLLTKARLGDKGDIPVYLSEDVTRYQFDRQFNIWHDRAVFHFLTDAADRKAYMSNLLRSLSNDGRAIIGTFSLQGPKACSGLDVVQYDEEKMNAELPGDLEIESSLINVHIKPDGCEQEYMYFVIRHKDAQA